MIPNPLFVRSAAAIFPFVIAAAAGAAATVKRVVIADGRGWTSTVAVGSSAAAPAQTLVLTNCKDGPLPTVRLVPGGSAILRNAGGLQCGLRSGFGLVTLNFDGVAESRLVFRNGGATVSSLVVPALEVALDAAHPQVRMRMVTNDLESEEGERTYLVVFGPPADMKLYVYDGSDDLIDVELIHDRDFDLTRQMLFYAMTTQQPIGSIILEPEQADQVWYGFASVGPANGTSSVVRPWEASPPPHF